MNVSTDSGGLCTGFMALQRTPTVERLLRIWSELGRPNIEQPRGLANDQGAFKILYANWAWIQNQVATIPTALVSNHECAQLGTVAHHFWSCGGAPERLADFQFTGA